MITIFSAMRPFAGTIGEVQMTAIRSWLALRPVCQVLLVDDEEGTTPEAVRALQVEVIRDVRRSTMGAPLLDDLLRVAREAARHDILAFNTADVLLPPEFPCVVERLTVHFRGRPFFASGARFDLDEPRAFDPSRPGWFADVHKAIQTVGRLHGHTALDLWIYPRDLDLQAPPMPIGRGGMDGWATHAIKRRGIPFIDCSPDLTLVHQHHDRPARKNPMYHQEFLQCLALFPTMAEDGLSLLDADWLLRGGQLTRPRGLRRLHSSMSFFRPYRLLVGRRRRFNLPHFYTASASVI